jgi:hypothetical protein
MAGRRVASHNDAEKRRTEAVDTNASSARRKLVTSHSSLVAARLSSDDPGNAPGHVLIGSSDGNVSVTIHHLAEYIPLFYLSAEFARRSAVEHAYFSADIVKLMQQINRLVV